MYEYLYSVNAGYLYMLCAKSSFLPWNLAIDIITVTVHPTHIMIVIVTVQEDAWEEVSIQHDSALRLAEVSHTSVTGNSRYTTSIITCSDYLCMQVIVIHVYCTNTYTYMCMWFTCDKYWSFWSMFVTVTCVCTLYIGYGRLWCSLQLCLVFLGWYGSFFPHCVSFNKPSSLSCTCTWDNNIL